MEQSNVLHPGQSQNDVQPQSPLHMSKLNLSNRFGTGMRFGQLAVCECLDGDGKDTIPLVSAHTVRSYTLSSQLLSDVYLKKDWFQVPKRAILPRNWEKVYVQPPIGDDVTQGVGTSYDKFTEAIASYLDPNGSYFDFTDLVQVFQWLTTIQYFYSYGSLISALGYSFERFFSFPSDVATVLSGTDIWNCDKFVDEVYTYLAQNFTGAKFFSATIGGKGYSVYFGIVPGIYGPNRISFRRFLELLHDDPSALTAITPGSSNLSTLIANIINDFSLVTITYDGSPFDLAFPAAYQMTCAHFYSNDSIDFVYSADLYRQVVGSIIHDFIADLGGTYDSDMFFTYNGVQTEYDYLSAYAISLILGDYYVSGILYPHFLRLCSVLFAWRQSLRFMDYFSGAKSRPLSIGNTNVAVVGNNVNVIEVIAQTARARFYNFANRARRKFDGWMEDLFHTKPSHDWHNPLYLGHIQDTIYAVETENTGDTQLVYDPNSGKYSGAPNSTTSQFKSNAERFAFEVELKEPSVIIGIEYFDIPRMYSHATRRMFFHEDRFDMFNPFMQTIGDQALYLRELTDNLQGQTYDFPFGYKYRHAEYKQSFDRCKGPFASGLLSSWVFSDDTPARGEDYVISPDFIRSSCSELDRFYLSLTHYSLANYFHFLVVNYNGIEAVRNMIVAPTLL